MQDSSQYMLELPLLTLHACDDLTPGGASVWPSRNILWHKAARPNRQGSQRRGHYSALPSVNRGQERPQGSSHPASQQALYTARCQSYHLSRSNMCPRDMHSCFG